MSDESKVHQGQKHDDNENKRRRPSRNLNPRPKHANVASDRVAAPKTNGADKKYRN